MLEIEQKFLKLFENGINFQNIDEKKGDNSYERVIHEESIIDILLKNNISIITGSNGIGKTYLIERLYRKFVETNINALIIKLKEYNSLEEVKGKINKENEIILFDGLDEININLIEDIKGYIFQVRDKKIILSSRKDFLQKYNLINAKYNIYEIMPIAKNRVIEILKNNNIEEKNVDNILDLLSIPRFLFYVINNSEIFKDINQIKNKYEILDMIVNQHLEVLNTRANTKIEKNIHKKILQSMALTMMMVGKVNFTSEELILFFSNINYLDIKSYILNEKIIDSFLENQLLMNNGETIQFENKEIMEFLAAKEIIENKFSNSNLYDIVSINNKEINPFWFNTISYLISGSNIYKKLILNYIYNNIEKEDNLLDLIFYINFTNNDGEFIKDIFPKIIFQYTKLYQYIYYKDNNISKIVSYKYNEIIENLIDIISNFDFSKSINEFDVIYINNILSIIINVIDNYKIKETILKKLREFIIGNKDYIVSIKKIRVRYYMIYLKIMDTDKIDELLKYEKDNRRLISLVLYDCDVKNQLKNFDELINNYIVNYNKRFDDELIFTGDKLLKDYIIANYDDNRLMKLIYEIKDIKKFESFLNFVDNNIEVIEKFDNEIIIKHIYESYIKDIIDIKSEDNMIFMDEVICTRKKRGAFERILESCIKYNFWKISNLSNDYKENYIATYINELIIKILLVGNFNEIEEIYNALCEKELLFRVWKNDLEIQEKEKYRNRIKSLFPKMYRQYCRQQIRLKNKDYINIVNQLNKILNYQNIYNIINDTNYLLKEHNVEIINSDIILKNTLNNIVKKIESHIKSIDINSLKIEYCSEDNSYSLNYIFQYYHEAIEILDKFGVNINKYNDKNIILLKNYDINKKIKYQNDDYLGLIEYLNNNISEGYVKFYLSEILDRLSKYNYKMLCSMIYEWIQKYDFQEYELNRLINILSQDINLIDINKINRIKEFRKYKSCHDLLILLNIESEISYRVNYIKEKLVVEGDKYDIEKDGFFEYSSKDYTYPLTKIDIKYIDYISDLVNFAFEKYNQGNYYRFTEYILDLATEYIKNNIIYNEIDSLIEMIKKLEKKCNNRYLFNICNNISMIKEHEKNDFISMILKQNNMMKEYDNKIYTYDDLINEVTDIIEKVIFNDIKRMNFFEIFRKKGEKMRTVNEQVFQFLIGYELQRILFLKGFKTKVVYESTGYDKKRSDIQLLTEGFIQNIIIETKLMENSDISNEENIKKYIQDTLKGYALKFNSKKILFVIINQTKTLKTCEKKMNEIRSNSNDFVTPILIDLKEIFDR